jgi:serine protease Do
MGYKSTIKNYLIIISIALLSSYLGAHLARPQNTANNLNNNNTNNKAVRLEESSATIDVAKKVTPSVVSIIASTKKINIFGYQDTTSGAGTGIIVSSEGLIMTNKHVVDGASEFRVITSDSKEYEAKLVSVDPTSNDLAFIKMTNAKGLTAAELGDSSAVEIGQKVIAIGNALGQFQNTVTTGIISGKGRPVTATDSSGGNTETLQNLFQTDAAINPGNSGGPLVTVTGQVIGINTAIAGDAQNIGFAIPINEVKGPLASVLETGRIIVPYLGVRYLSITKEFAALNNLKSNSGALIKGSGSNSAVVSGSPADKAGVKEGDIIVKIDGVSIDSNHSLQAIISNKKVGDNIKLDIIRDGKNITLEAKLAASS